jgi:hypothetical protein
MAVLTFGPAEVVAEHLRATLLEWAALHANAFAPDQITKAIPLENVAGLGPEGRDVANYLNAAIALADTLQDEPERDAWTRRRDYLAGLYSALAGPVWQASQRGQSPGIRRLLP